MQETHFGFRIFRQTSHISIGLSILHCNESETENPERNVILPAEPCLLHLWYNWDGQIEWYLELMV